MNTYLAYVYKDPASSFGVSFPDLPGCYGAGETYDEALENAKVSLREYARTLADDGEDMPKPRTHGELMANATEAIELDKAAFVAEVPLITAGTRRRINLSLDDRLLAAIDRASGLAGVNRSSFIAELAMQWLEERMNAVMVKPKKKKSSKRVSRSSTLAIA